MVDARAQCRARDAFPYHPSRAISAFKAIKDIIGTSIDAAGVLAMVMGVVVATARWIRGAPSGAQSGHLRYREDIGRAILRGLREDQGAAPAAPAVRLDALTQAAPV
ncbi:hypothetical protein BH11PLA1_BH11PLA1_06870 [soil metagenome]